MSQCCSNRSSCRVSSDSKGHNIPSYCLFSWTRNSAVVSKRGVSLPFSKETTDGPHSDPAESRPQYYTIFIYDQLFKILIESIYRSIKVVSYINIYDNSYAFITSSMLDVWLSNYIIDCTIHINKWRPVYCSRFSNSLRAGRSRARKLVWARFSAFVQTGFGAHVTSCRMGSSSLS